MRKFLKVAAVAGATFALAACNPPSEETTEGETAAMPAEETAEPVADASDETTEPSAAPDERIGPDERVGPDERTGPDERSGPTED